MSAVFTPKPWADLSVTDQKIGYGYRENYEGVMAERKAELESYAAGKSKEQFLSSVPQAEELLQMAESWGFTVGWVDD